MVVDLSEAYFCRDLTPRELKKLEGIAEEQRLAPGEVIVAVADEINHLFVIRSGEVRVTIPTDASGEPVEEVLARMGPGECFGEFSFADRKPASASIVADQETLVYRVAHADLDRLLESDPALARKVLGAMFRTVVSRLRATAAELVLARYVVRFV